jgi:hypothetical protein
VGIVLGDIAWWGPIAIVGGGVLGLLTAYLLLAFVGTSSPGGSGAADRIRYEATDQTNYTRPNPAALLVAFCIVALIVGLAIGLSAD